MSKKTKRQAEEKAASKAANRAEINRHATQKPNGRVAKGAVRAYARPEPTNKNLVLGVRIAMAVIALAALAGGLVWGASVKGNYTTGVVIGVIVLGFVAGLGAFLAIRAEEVVKSVQQRARR